MDEIVLLKQLAYNIRKNVLDMTFNSGANGGHLGGAFSCADILAVLYGKIMNVSPATVLSKERDRFILSKGHCSIAHYAVLKECGYLSQAEMEEFETFSTQYSTHEIINQTKGIEISSGSLGYGLSIGIGIALNAKRNNYSYNTFVLLGDGECNEGTVWESVMAAARFKLNNLVAIVDVNGQSLDGFTNNIMPINSFEQVWVGFGWNVISVDGNNIVELLNAFSKLSVDKPNVLIAKTTKGKGLKSIEGNVGWHHVRLSEEQYNSFKKELEGVV